jgi:hypothetical protein
MTLTRNRLHDRRAAKMLVLLCAMTSTIICVAQPPASFNAVTTTNPFNTSSGVESSNIHAADLNNDGLTDIVQDVQLSPDQFVVSLAKGNGTFKAPVYYNFPVPGQGGHALALADLNGDGNIDLVAAMLGTPTLVVYLGNGDGTLQAPKTYTLDLLGYSWIGLCWPVAADFNHDGKVDLVLTVEGPNSTYDAIYVLPGKGDGTFAAPEQIYQVPNPLIAGVEEMVVGDFDGDTNPDIAFIENSSSGYSTGVLYGDGHFGFANAWVYSNNNYSTVILGSGDLDSDGRTDIIVIDAADSPPSLTSGKLHVLYGRNDRNFDGYTTTIPAFNDPGVLLTPQIRLADFNDAGRMDFGLFLANPQSDAGFLTFFLNQGTRGQFGIQLLDLHAPAYEYSASNAVVGLFNRDDKPDVALEYDTFAKSENIAELNGDANGVWSNCPYPLNGRGISLCSPTSSADGPVTSPVNFNAAAHSFGQLRKMELWVDGSKLGEQYRAWENSAFFSLIANLPVGTHKGTYFATDIDNTEQKLDFFFTVGTSNCSPPTTDAVRVCSLIPSSAGVLIQASATVSGTLARMELWADGAKEYTETTSNHLSASIALTKGTHDLTVVAVNTAGASWTQTASVNVP